MKLTPQEEAMAAGDMGPGIQRCMDILIKLGRAGGAERLVPIASAHTMPKEPLELLAEMTEGVAQTGTFTTTHSVMSSFSPVSWRAMGLPESFALDELDKFQERSERYCQAGFCETYTCLPMLVGNLPLKGDYVSWIGSGAQLIANSLLGARCNRDGTVINLAAAVTGRAPLQGLFLDENRKGQVLARFDGLDPQALSQAQLGAVGYHLGAKAMSRNLVIEGLPRDMGLDRLKYLLAPLAVTGSVCLCHIVGMTPEAPDLEAAFGGQKPEEVFTLGQKEIQACQSQYAGEGRDADMVIFGCPHYTISEIRTMAGQLEGKKIENGKRLWIGLPHQHYALAQMMGYAQTIEEAGGVFASACMAAIPDAPIPDGVRVVATNSFKAAHYISRLTKDRVKLVVGNQEQCLKAVTGGKWEGGPA